jgi:hypothetical protein
MFPLSLDSSLAASQQAAPQRCVRAAHIDKAAVPPRAASTAATVRCATTHAGTPISPAPAPKMTTVVARQNWQPRRLHLTVLHVLAAACRNLVCRCCLWRSKDDADTLFIRYEVGFRGTQVLELHVCFFGRWMQL